MLFAAVSLLFTLTDVAAGTPVRLDQVDSDILVLVFTGYRCPISRAYSGALSAVQSEYRNRGIRLLAINSNESETVEKIRRAAEQDDLRLTILKDARHGLADELGARYTPEVFVLDRERNVRYRGAIGNSERVTANPHGVNAVHLRSALDALLAGQPVAHPFVRSFGCAIERSALTNPRKH